MEADLAQEVAAVGPARVYRELLYRPGGALHRWLDERFVVVARPGDVLATDPAAGDLLVRIALGIPGAGHVDLLLDPALVPSRLGEQLDALGEGPGLYATVLDEEALDRPERRGRSRRILSLQRRMPAGHLLLRPRAIEEPDQGVDDGPQDEALPTEAAAQAAGLGGQLVSRFPAGVRVAVYDADTPEFTRRAAEWARREEAVGAAGATIDASSLAVGVAMPDARGLVRTVVELGQALAMATGATTGPARIRTLALFSHGWGTTLSIGLGLTAGNVDDVVARLAPVLTDDVSIVIYGCSVCSQPGEGGWVATTMGPGGIDSLCGKIRDALVERGKTSASVWGHTEVGHTTRNWSLRRFQAAPSLPQGGRRSPGTSYAGEIVFGPEKANALAQLEAAIGALGFRPVEARRPQLTTLILARLDRELYRAYGQANRTRTHGGANLSERAPLYPDEVAEIIRVHWRDTYWVPRQVRTFAGRLMSELRSLRLVEPVPVGGGQAPSGNQAEGVWEEATEEAQDLVEQPVHGVGPGDSVAEEPRSLAHVLGSLPFLLAGPIVRRVDDDSVWFWFASSEEIRSCTPSLTVYNADGSVHADLTRRMVLEPTQPQVARLGQRLWVAVVQARPKSLSLSPGWTYGYDLTISGSTSTTPVRQLVPELAYPPFDRPTFKRASSGTDRIAHGSCRRPGGYGADAFPAFEAWMKKEIAAGVNGERPPALILTGDQIYADDVAYPLFRAVQRLAADVFGYAERLPTPDGRRERSVDDIRVDDWRDRPGEAWISSARAALTRRPAAKPDRPGKIGFTTEDGEGHLLSFAEYAAMYLLTWNPELWKAYVSDQTHPTDAGTRNLRGFGDAVAASRRVLANVATYMLFDDHDITDDWNLDADWVRATGNPMARRIISNGLAAYWAFQAWGNDPSQFTAPFVQAVVRHLQEISDSRGSSGAAAGEFDKVLHARHWSFVAPTRPQALCVDTRTRRDCPANAPVVLSGPSVWPELRALIAKHRFKAKAPLLIVLPTPLLAHRSVLKVQAMRHPWPKGRYEGDWEFYGNNPAQRAELIWFLRSQLDPSSLVVFSGDVHHGSVVDGLYVGGPSLEDIYLGKGRWAIRVVQVTSSPIKNIKKDAYIDPTGYAAYLTDAGNLGESVVAQYENMHRTMDDGTIVAMRAAVKNLTGPLGRQTFVFENHLCVVDIGHEVETLFVGTRINGWHATAKTRVSLSSDPTTFRPPHKWLLERARDRVPSIVGYPAMGS